MKGTRRLILIFLSIVAAWYGVRFLNTLFEESLYTKRGTFEFYVSISEPVIRNFPTPEIVGEADYYASCGDGPKPPEVAVTFRSRLPLDAVRDLGVPFIRSHGFVASNPNPRFPEYDTPGKFLGYFQHGEDYLSFSATSEPDGITSVQVSVTY